MFVPFLSNRGGCGCFYYYYYYFNKKIENVNWKNIPLRGLPYFVLLEKPEKL